MENRNKKIVSIVTLSIMIFFLFLFSQGFGYIEDDTHLTPTGNVDIFEVNCLSCKNDDDSADIPSTGEDNSCSYTPTNENSKNNQKTPDNNKSDSNKNDNIPDKDKRSDEGNKDKDNEDNKDNEDEDEDEKESEEEEPFGHGEVSVDDNYKVWDNKDLRIFENPAYEYEHIIAPGSSNSYVFVVRNNNDFNIKFDITFSETNENNINMSYKLKNNNNYLVGSENSYEKINNRKIENLTLSKNSYKTFILDWKWVDAENDASVGFDINASYKLSIKISSK